MASTLIQGESLEEMKKLPDGSADCVVTDPPYGYSFMGKDWDKAVVGVETWKECLRVLKPGAFAFVMSAPRQDVLGKMISHLTDAGFKTDFTSIYWTYSTGFPKAMNIGKMVDKRMGAKRERIRVPEAAKDSPDFGKYKGEIDGPDAITSEAKALDGSYGNFSPKPAVEVIIVAMKPRGEKTSVDQALSWLHERQEVQRGLADEMEKCYGITDVEWELPSLPSNAGPPGK